MIALRELITRLRMRSAVALWTVLCVSFLTSSADASNVVYEILLNIHGEDTLTGIGRYIQGIGDVNGDSFDDIAVYTFSPPETRVYYGGNPPDTIFDLLLPQGRILSPYDYDGDGINDVTIMRPTIGLEIFKGFGDSLGSIPIVSIPFHIYRNADVAYVNGDIYADYVTESSRTSPIIDSIVYFESPYVNGLLPTWIHEYPNRKYDIRDLGFIDFNCDNYQDLFVGLWPETASVGAVEVYYGPDFGMTPDLTILPPAIADSGQPKIQVVSVANIGDFNTDGREDLAVRFGLVGVIYLSEIGGDTNHDFVLPHVGTSIARAGDVNGDGFNDVISELWIVGYGGAGIFLGGPYADTVCDAVITRNDLPPLYLDRIGYAVAHAGDVDNDGLDEIFFSSQNFFGGEPHDVWVIKGSEDITTAVTLIPDESLPSDYQLSQNYPNPFNPETVIEYALPTKSIANVEIHNVLGQKITTLVDEEHSAGSYRVRWDGRDATGDRVASGVYFYSLKVDGAVIESRKMVMVK